MAESLDSILERTLESSGPESRKDAIVLALHSCLLSAGYVCTAVGDEKFGEVSSTSLPAIATSAQPQLPASWNSTQDVYALQYRHEQSNEMCLVKVVPLGDQLLLNAVKASKSDEVYSVSIEVSKYVKDGADLKSVSSFKNLLELMTILSKEIESKLSQSFEKPTPVMVGVPVSSGEERERRRDLSTTHDEDDPLRIGPPRQPRLPRGDFDPLADPRHSGYGEGDRLPFGGSGGMIFDPLRQGRGMPGYGPTGPFPPSHPHGARFDPVSPLGPRPMPHPPGRNPPRNRGPPGFYGPDPDHLPPPGYDDMFS